MIKISNNWLILASAGYGIVLAMALASTAQFLGSIVGLAVTGESAARICLMVSLVTVPFAAYGNTANGLFAHEIEGEDPRRFSRMVGINLNERR